MDKKKALSEIAKEITVCRECKKDTIGKPVPGEGNPNAQIVFVGEAPGKQEAATGRPFIGRSGKLLRSAMEEIGLDPQQVFITSVGKYLPKNGRPTVKQITHGRKHLLKQIEIIHPRIVVLLGSVAAQGIMGEKIPVKILHGTTRIVNGIILFLTIHPAAALRFQPFKEIFLEDFHVLQTLLQKEHLI